MRTSRLALALVLLPLLMSGCGYEELPEPSCRYTAADLEAFRDRVDAIHASVEAAATAEQVHEPFISSRSFLERNRQLVWDCHAAARYVDLAKSRDWDRLWDASWLMAAGARAASEPAETPFDHQKHFMLSTVETAKTGLSDFDADRVSLAEPPTPE